MSVPTRNVLFLCTGNSARSILGEALLNAMGEGRFRAFSAGSQPKGQVHPGALAKLQAEGLPIAGLRSKSWDEFGPQSEAAIDIVITVCANAAGESCPLWRGSPATAHWGLPDPAAVDEPDWPQAFTRTYEALQRRIAALLALDLDGLSEMELKQQLAAIGEGADR